MSHHESARWLVAATGLPLIRRRCLTCPSQRYRAHGKFRINANHKLLDVWLLALCDRCGETIKLTVFERANVRTIAPEALDRFHDNDATMAAELLADPLLLRRNNVALDWDDAWTIHKTPPEVPGSDTVEVSVHFTQRIPLRLTRLLAVGLSTSRSEVQRLIDDGTLSSAQRLTAKSSTDFTFTLRRPEPLTPGTLLGAELPRRARPRSLGDIAALTRPEAALPH